MFGSMFDVREVVQEAYNAYGESLRSKNPEGEPLPDWDDLPDDVKQAWMMAVQHTLDVYHTHIFRAAGRVNSGGLYPGNYISGGTAMNWSGDENDGDPLS